MTFAKFAMHAVATLISLVPLVARATPGTLEPGVPTGNRLVANIFEQVYQIKTATDANAPKAAYGSCFVVDPSGLLATNFHVVAFALHEPEKYNLYLMDGDHILPAEVVAFDAVNDLALVHVQRTFPKAVAMASSLPAAGAKIYSIGWPEDLNKSVIEGNFNGLMSAGPYRRLQMSIPLNPGMSGGPIINESGEVLGVNVSIRVDSQNLAFAVPSDLVKALRKKPHASYSLEGSRAAFDEEVRGQLEHVQEQLTAALLKGNSTTVTVGPWMAQKPVHMLKCWHEEEAGPRELTSITTENCYLPGATPVRSDTDTGTFRIKYQAITSSQLSEWQYLHQVNEQLAGLPFNLAEHTERFTTPFTCATLDLVNAHKVPLRVHYCVNAYVRYAELYNIELEAVTLQATPGSMLVAGSFLGFSSHNASEVIRTLLSSIRPESP